MTIRYFPANPKFKSMKVSGISIPVESEVEIKELERLVKAGLVKREEVSSNPEEVPHIEVKLEDPELEPKLEVDSNQEPEELENKLEELEVDSNLLEEPELESTSNQVQEPRIERKRGRRPRHSNDSN